MSKMTMETISSALWEDPMSDSKICRKCRRDILIEDYYFVNGKPRSECKQCTITRNSTYQKKVKAWRNREVDPDARRLYMRNYYLANKEKYVQHRTNFKAKHPDYYKNYFRNLKR